MLETDVGRTPLRSVGVLLVGGLVLGLAAAWMPSLGPVWNARPPDQLLLIADRHRAWISASGLFAAGLVVALFGVLVLCGLMLRAGAEAAAWVGIGSFLVGTTLWLIHLGFRMTVMASVATDMKGGSPMPRWFMAGWDLGNYLLVAYVALASVGLVATAIGVLQTGLLPGWTAWVTIVLATTFVVTLIVLGNTMPVLPHLATGLIGVVALLAAQ